MRLFFALDLPDELKAELAAFQAKARILGHSASWPDARNLHLTLAFLGEQPEERLPALREIGNQAAEPCPPLALRTAELGGFPRPSRARVLWLGLEADAGLAALTRALRKCLMERGFTPDPKPFTAHLTLARFQPPADIRSFGPCPSPQRFEARELVLYQSHLGPKGSRYEPVDRFSFNGNQGGGP